MIVTMIRIAHWFHIVNLSITLVIMLTWPFRRERNLIDMRFTRDCNYSFKSIPIISCIFTRNSGESCKFTRLATGGENKKPATGTSLRKSLMAGNPLFSGTFEQNEGR